MATSSKQTAANRNNARKSTGPQTLGGKARSRQNAVKHGLTGAGIALPTEDAAEVDRRFLGLHSEMGASSMLADLLVHRVALMSVRLDRSARQEAKALSEKIRRAGADFDEARAAEADHLLGWIGSEPVSHRRKLLRTPEGTDRLIAALLGLREELDRDGQLFWDFNHTLKIEAYFGRRELDLPPSRGYVLSKAITGDFARLDPKEVAHCSTDGEKRNWAADELMLHIDAEVARLRAHRETLDHEAIALDRAEAAERAMFDPSKDATLARRYERAAERGFYQALHEFRAVEASPRAEADEEFLEAGDELIIPPVEEIAANNPIDDHESKSPKPLSRNDLESEMGSFGNNILGPKADLGSPASTKPLGDLGRLSGGLVSLFILWLVLFGARVEASGCHGSAIPRNPEGSPDRWFDDRDCGLPQTRDTRRILIPDGIGFHPFAICDPAVANPRFRGVSGSPKAIPFSTGQDREKRSSLLTRPQGMLNLTGDNDSTPPDRPRLHAEVAELADALA